MQHISRFLLWLMGWKIVGELPDNIKKCVIIMAPHTSNIDYFIGILGFTVLRLKVRILIKKEAFIFPFGYLLKKTGCIPVKRGKVNHLIEISTELFNKNHSLILVITPEGTRGYNPIWKKGFYHISTNAKVPIVLGYLDYASKTGGLGEILYPSGNFQNDFHKIEEFYRTKTARHPEKFNLSSANTRQN